MAQAYTKEKKNPSTLEGRVMINIGVKPQMAMDFDTLCDSIDMNRSEVLRMLMTYAVSGTNKKGTPVISEIYKFYHKFLSEQGI